jgi:hypothetical protein
MFFMWHNKPLLEEIFGLDISLKAALDRTINNIFLLASKVCCLELDLVSF